MSTTKTPSRSLVTSEFRMSYPSILNAREFVDPKTKAKTGKFSYQVEALFKPDDLKAFRMYDDATRTYSVVDASVIFADLATEAWGALPLIDPQSQQPVQFSVKHLFGYQGLKNGQLNGWPIRKGDIIAQYREAGGKRGEFYKGTSVMSFKSYKNDNMPAPSLSMVTGSNTYKNLDRTNAADMDIAKSLFVGGNFAFATINVQAKDIAGVHYLVPYINSIRFTRKGDSLGGQTEMDRFDGVVGGVSPHDPTAGMDDEISF